jgi:hypothetical protein
MPSTGRNVNDGMRARNRAIRCDAGHQVAE